MIITDLLLFSGLMVYTDMDGVNGYRLNKSVLMANITGSGSIVNKSNFNILRALSKEVFHVLVYPVNLNASLKICPAGAN